MLWQKHLTYKEGNCFGSGSPGLSLCLHCPLFLGLYWGWITWWMPPREEGTRSQHMFQGHLMFSSVFNFHFCSVSFKKALTTLIGDCLFLAWWKYFIFWYLIQSSKLKWTCSQRWVSVLPHSAVASQITAQEAYIIYKCFAGSLGLLLTNSYSYINS